MMVFLISERRTIIHESHSVSGGGNSSACCIDNAGLGGGFS